MLGMTQVSWCVVLLAVGACSCRDKPPPVAPKDEAEGHYLAGQTAYLKGDFVEAHAQFDQVKRLMPGDARLAAAEAEVFLSEGKLDEALARFEEASTRDPARSTTWSRLASLYALKKQTDKAAHALDRALELNPKDYNALELRAEVALGRGALDEAVSWFGRAADAAPEKARAELLQRATAELEKAHRQGDALALLETAARAGRLSGLAQVEYAERLVVANRLTDALAAYTKAAESTPTDPGLWELVGELELRLGHDLEAEAAFKKSLAIKNRAVVHIALAKICLRTDAGCVSAQLDQAIESASGEELRETTDLAELLITLDRKRDALTLLRSVSEEADQKGNTSLQLRTARLARDLKDDVTVQAACTRALSTGQAGVRCP